MSQYKQTRFEDQVNMAKARASVISNESKQVKSKIQDRDSVEKQSIRAAAAIQSPTSATNKPQLPFRSAQLTKSPEMYIKTEGTDDEDPAAYHHNRGDSSSEQDPDFQTISDEGDTKYKMRHIEKEKEEQSNFRRKVVSDEEVANKREMMVQTTPPKAQEPVREYVAPPSRSKGNDKSYEYQAPDVYDDPDECEFQAPESESDVRKPAVSTEKKQKARRDAQEDNFKVVIAERQQRNQDASPPPQYIHRSSPMSRAAANSSYNSNLQLKPKQMTTGGRGSPNPMLRKSNGSPNKKMQVTQPTTTGIRGFENQIQGNTLELQEMMAKKKEVLKGTLDQKKQQNEQAKKQKLLEYKNMLIQVQEEQKRQNEEMQEQIKNIKRQMAEVQEDQEIQILSKTLQMQNSPQRVRDKASPANVKIKDYPSFEGDHQPSEAPSSIPLSRARYDTRSPSKSPVMKSPRRSLETVVESTGMLSQEDYETIRNVNKNKPTESVTMASEVRRNQNLGFQDSASQQNRSLNLDQTDFELPSIEELRNRPFTSNLENAKILAKLTKIRINKLELTPKNRKIEDIKVEHEPHAFQQESMNQQKINKYLNDTLKHMNITIDILIDQYDPVKLKQQSKQQAEEEREYYSQANKLKRKLEEIKNAEKTLKTTQRELISISKKYEKVKDWKYLASLYKQVDRDARKIESIEKDNKKLKAEQKKSDMKLVKVLNNRGVISSTSEINHQELIELDNELNVHRHKSEYMQDKLYQQQLNEREQEKKLETLKLQLKQTISEEQKVIEMGRKLYGIDFDDVEQQKSKVQQDDLATQKDKLMKKLVIIEDSKNSIDKQYQAHHRANQKKMAQLQEMKRQMQEQLKAQDEALKEKVRQMQYYKEQKVARDVIMKVRSEKGEQFEKETIQTVRPISINDKINQDQPPATPQSDDDEMSGFQVSNAHINNLKDKDNKFMTDDEDARDGDHSPLSYKKPGQVTLGKKSQRQRKRLPNEEITIIKETLAEEDDMENITTVNLEEKLKSPLKSHAPLPPATIPEEPLSDDINKINLKVAI